MNSLKKIFLYLLFSLLPISLVSAQDSTRPFLFAYYDFPPFYKENEKNEAVGIVNVVVEKIFKTAGLKIEQKIYPPKRAYALVVEGKEAHFTIAAINNPIFKDTTISSKSTIATLTVDAYYMEGTSPIKTKEDLKGKSIVLIRGYGYAGMTTFFNDPANKITIQEVDKHELAYTILKEGRASYLVDYDYPIKKIFKANNETKVVRVNFLSVPIKILISKNLNGAKELAAKLDSAFAELVEKNEIDLPGYQVVK
ncbi:MAG: transporter substrate-binding domain-containing protein [Oligoflexia bacterium]|nr:transporter substrate-binding domain-containing protein [Oligoflexia bacterium]